MSAGGSKSDTSTSGAADAKEEAPKYNDKTTRRYVRRLDIAAKRRRGLRRASLQSVFDNLGNEQNIYIFCRSLCVKLINDAYMMLMCVFLWHVMEWNGIGTGCGSAQGNSISLNLAPPPKDVAAKVGGRVPGILGPPKEQIDEDEVLLM